MNFPTAFPTTILLLSISMLPSAHAQSLTSPTSNTVADTRAQAQGGNGFKLGNGRLHSDLRIDTHYITNPGRLPSSATPLSDLTLNTRINLEYKMPSDVIDTHVQASVEYRRYLGIEEARSRDLSQVSADGLLDVTFNKKGIVAVRVREHVQRITDPGMHNEQSPLSHLITNSGINFDVKPGGKALTLSTGYSFAYDIYDESNANRGLYENPEALNRITHQPTLRALWRFLPKTALLIEAGAQLARYPNKRPLVNREASITNVDMNAARATVGLVGDISSRISLLLKAGYHNSNLDIDNLQTAFGQAEVTYAFAPTIQLTWGAERSIEPISYYKYLTSNRTYLQLSAAFSSKTQFQLSANYGYLQFGESLVANVSRNDHSIIVRASISQPFTPWMSIALSNTFDFRDSDNPESLNTGTGSTGLLSTSYLYNDLFLSLNFRY